MSRLDPHKHVFRMRISSSTYTHAGLASQTPNTRVAIHEGPKLLALLRKSVTIPLFCKTLFLMRIAISTAMILQNWCFCSRPSFWSTEGQKAKIGRENVRDHGTLGTIVLVLLWMHEVQPIAPRDLLSPLSTMSGVTTRVNLCGWNEEYRC